MQCSVLVGCRLAGAGNTVFLVGEFARREARCLVVGKAAWLRVAAVASEGGVVEAEAGPEVEPVHTAGRAGIECKAGFGEADFGEADFGTADGTGTGSVDLDSAIESAVGHEAGWLAGHWGRPTRIGTKAVAVRHVGTEPDREPNIDLDLEQERRQMAGLGSRKVPHWVARLTVS
jgi:hypothetical protein